MTTLESLRELTKELQYHYYEEGLSIADQPAGSGAPAILEGLWKSQEVAVCHATITQGSIVPFHAHEEFEVIVIYSGTMVVKYPDTPEGEVYTAPAVVSFLPGQSHQVEYLDSDVRLVALTIPASEGWPKERFRV